MYNQVVIFSSVWKAYRSKKEIRTRSLSTPRKSLPNVDDVFPATFKHKLEHNYGRIFSKGSSKLIELDELLEKSLSYQYFLLQHNTVEDVYDLGD